MRTTKLRTLYLLQPSSLLLLLKSTVAATPTNINCFTIILDFQQFIYMLSIYPDHTYQCKRGCQSPYYLSYILCSILTIYPDMYSHIYVVSYTVYLVIYIPEPYTGLFLCTSIYTLLVQLLSYYTTVYRPQCVRHSSCIRYSSCTRYTDTQHFMHFVHHGFSFHTPWI